MLDTIKILLGVCNNSEDLIISTLIEITTQEIKSYCNVDTVQGLESLLIDMVVYKYNRLGTEGLTAENYGEVNYTYTSDYPDNIKRLLDKNRRMVIL